MTDLLYLAQNIDNDLSVFFNNIDAPNMITMENIFRKSYIGNNASLRNINVPKVTSMEKMFNLAMVYQVNLNNIKTNSLISKNEMFLNNNYLQNVFF